MPQFGLEGRIDLARMRKERVERLRAQMTNDGIGAFLCFAPDDIRYLTDDLWTTSSMGELAAARNVLFPRTGDPVLFEWGSRYERIRDELAPWLKGNVRPGWRLGWFLGRGIYPEAFVKDLKDTLATHGLTKEPVAIDASAITIDIKNALEKADIKVVDGSPCILRARSIRTEDELNCQRKVASICDAVYAALRDAIRPGIREFDLVAIGGRVALERGADELAGFLACSGENSSPNMAVYTDRTINHGDLIFFDLCNTRWHGYRVCYYRTFCCGKANQRQKDFHKKSLELTYLPIRKVKAGVTTAELCKTWPGPETWGGKTWWDVSECAIGHSIGLSKQEPPGITPLFSIDHPYTLRENMVIALESWYGSRKEPPIEGCRFEETGIVTKDGYEVLTKWPKDEITECY